MQAIQTKRPIAFKKQIIPPWQWHLVFDAVLRTIMQENDGRDIMVTEATGIPWWDGKRPVKNMLVFGGGGMGDRVQSTPAFRKLAQRIDAPIDVAINEYDEWLNLPYIANFQPWILPWDYITSYDAVCSFENVLGQPDERTTHLAELFARRCFVSPLVPGVAPFDPGEFECDWAWGYNERERITWLPEKDPRNIWVGLQVASHGFSRTWPLEFVIDLAMRLSKTRQHNIVVILLGSAKQSPKWAGPARVPEAPSLPEPPQDIVNLCGRLTGVRQLAAVIDKLDFLVAPDSGPLHLAGVLNTPSIGLYGPHIYETRGLWFPTQRPIVARDYADPRCPCLCHSDQQIAQLPCGADHCRLMAMISVDEVFKEVLGWIDEAKASLERQDNTCFLCGKTFTGKAGVRSHQKQKHTAEELQASAKLLKDANLRP